MAIPLTIGGQERPLRFDFDAILLAEDTLAYPIRPLITRHRALTASQIVTLIWAAWRQETRTLSTEQVRGWVRDYCMKDGGSLLQIENAIVDALIESGIIIPLAADAARPQNGAAPATAPASTGTR